MGYEHTDPVSITHFCEAEYDSILHCLYYYLRFSGDTKAFIAMRNKLKCAPLLSWAHWLPHYQWVDGKEGAWHVADSYLLQLADRFTNLQQWLTRIQSQEPQTSSSGRLTVRETVYRGYRMRSRLEARWGVFFDALGIKWEYEPEGYTSNGVSYLPDFRLLDYERNVEIKPTYPSADALRKAAMVDAYIFAGNPWHGEYEILHPNAPYVGAIEELCLAVCPYCQRVIFTTNYAVPDHYVIGFGCPGYMPSRDMSDNEYTSLFEVSQAAFEGPAPGALQFAYLAARQARFEHGD